jgi:hypothetical protein
MSYLASILIIFAIISSISIDRLGVDAKPNNQIDKIWKVRKSICEKSPECTLKPLDESQNCINKCVSRTCFDFIYAAEPLEDGEIDTDRAHKFTNCLRKEERDKKVKEWNKK